jgi:hypothetical protein
MRSTTQMTSTRYFLSFAGHQCPPGAWWHQLQFWWAYIGGSRPQIALLSMWHKVACRLCKREKAGAKDSVLCDARSHFALCRVSTFEDYFLGGPVRKSAIHDSVLLLTPELWSFRRWRRGGTLSKAFEKYRSTASICWTLTRSAAMSCKVRISWLPYNVFFRNPCCKSERRLWCSRWVMMVEWRICSRVLHKMEVS